MREERGVSNVVGIVLILAITLAAVTSLMVVGAVTLQDFQSETRFSQMETSMAEMSSKISGVALGDASAKEFKLSDRGDGTMTSDPSEGTMTIKIYDGDGNLTQSSDIDLGAIVFQKEDRTIAYQGGGIWKNSGGSTEMVSPPQFEYRANSDDPPTLTLPVMSVENQGEISQSGVIRDRGSRAVDVNRVIDEGEVKVKVQSTYYEGWAEYFTHRTDAEPEINHTEQSVTATLVAPPNEVTLDSAVIAKGDLTIKGAGSGGSSDDNGGGPPGGGGGGPPGGGGAGPPGGGGGGPPGDDGGGPHDRITGPVTLGGTTNSPGAINGPLIQHEESNADIPEAESIISEARDRLESEDSPDESTVEAGKWYVDSDDLFQSTTTFDTTDGDIELFVDGDVHQHRDVNVVGSNDVDVYINGEYDMRGQVEWGAAEHVNQTTVYSLEVERITMYYGVLYTDAVSVKGAGGGGPNNPDLIGAVVTTDDNFEMAGQIHIQYDESLGDPIFVEDTEFATLVYLHVTENIVEIES